MSQWNARAVVVWDRVVRRGGTTLRLEVEPSEWSANTSSWYWRVRDEEGNTVNDGIRATALQAKASAIRAANKAKRL